MNLGTSPKLYPDFTASGCEAATDRASGETCYSWTEACRCPLIVLISLDLLILRPLQSQSAIHRDCNSGPGRGGQTSCGRPVKPLNFLRATIDVLGLRIRAAEGTGPRTFSFPGTGRSVRTEIRRERWPAHTWNLNGCYCNTPLGQMSGRQSRSRADTPPPPPQTPAAPHDMITGDHC